MVIYQKYFLDLLFCHPPDAIFWTSTSHYQEIGDKISVVCRMNFLHLQLCTPILPLSACPSTQCQFITGTTIISPEISLGPISGQMFTMDTIKRIVLLPLLILRYFRDAIDNMFPFCLSPQFTRPADSHRGSHIVSRYLMVMASPDIAIIFS